MRALIFSLICVFISNISFANNNQPSLQQIQQLIKASGIELQINEIPKALQQSAQTSGPAGLFIKPLMQSLEQVFKPDEMMAILQKDLMSRLDVPTMLDALTWYNSSNGKQIIKAQQSILQPDVLEQVGNALMQQSNPSSPQRQQLITQLMQSNQSVDIALDLMVTTQAAIMSGLSHMVTPNQPQSFESLSQSFASNKHLMRDQIQKQIHIQQSVIYKNLDDATLKQFLKFSDSNSGQKLFRALNASLNHTLKTVAQRIPATMQSAAKPAAR